jgi:hypothetical protein
MFVWQTSEKYLASTFVRSIKCNRTRITGMKSLRNLFYLVHRTNVVDSSWIKTQNSGRKKRRRRKMMMSAFLLLTIRTLIVCEITIDRYERDHLPWQDAVTRSVLTNEIAIRCTYLLFLFLPIEFALVRVHLDLTQGIEEEKERKTSNWTVLPSHTHTHTQ